MSLFVVVGLCACATPEELRGAGAMTSLGGTSVGGDAEGDDSDRTPDPGSSSTADPESDSDSASDSDPSGPPVTSDDAPGSTGDAVPTPQDCSFTSAGPQQELDVPPGSGDVLTFTVAGLPDEAAVSSATLHFDSYDADHPGEEGVVYVNGNGPYDLPANAAWDNANGTGSIDITGATVAGSNTVEFGAGSFSGGSFYRIANVRIDMTANVVDCPEAPPPEAFERTVTFTEATYTQRHNWVLRNDGFQYAFTAYGDEHLDSDMDGLYDPDGTRTGTAIFSFPDLVDATYQVSIHSRHTVNRNPAGALFVVDGVGQRIFQNDNADFTTDIWGDADLGGDVDVVLDSTMENASDSVVWVRLTPVP